MNNSKKQRALRNKELKERVETLEKHNKVISKEYELLLAEYRELYSGFKILQRSLKLIILDNEGLPIVYSYKIAKTYQGQELDAIEIIVSDNEEDDRIEFKVTDCKEVTVEE